MTTTPITGTTLTEEGANNVPVVNTALLRIEWLAAPLFQQMDLNTPPGSPSNGQAWFTGSSPTGDWADQGSKIAFYYDGWAFWSPSGGMQAFNENTNEWVGYSSQESQWHPMQERFSTTEHWTGKYDDGGDLIYSKVVDFGALPAGCATSPKTKSVAHSITGLNLGKNIIARVSAVRSGTNAFMMPLLTTSLASITQVTYDATNINIQSISNLSAYSCKFRLEYHKT